MSQRRVTAVNFTNEYSTTTTATNIVTESQQQLGSDHEEEESVSCSYSFLYKLYINSAYIFISHLCLIYIRYLSISAINNISLVGKLESTARAISVTEIRTKPLPSFMIIKLI